MINIDIQIVYNTWSVLCPPLIEAPAYAALFSNSFATNAPFSSPLQTPFVATER